MTDRDELIDILNAVEESNSWRNFQLADAILASGFHKRHKGDEYEAEIR